MDILFHELCKDTKNRELPWHIELVKEINPIYAQKLLHQKQEENEQVGVWRSYQYWTQES